MNIFNFIKSKKVWQQYKTNLIEENPFKNNITTNFLYSRKMTSAKILLPLVIVEILDKKNSYMDVVNDTLHYIYFVRASDDIVDEGLSKKDPQITLDDIFKYGISGDKTIFDDYKDNNLTATAGYLLRSHLENMCCDNKYVEFIQKLKDSCKNEFSSNKIIAEEARLKVSGLYVEGLYAIASTKLKKENSDLKKAMHLLGLSARYYDDLADEKDQNTTIKLYNAKKLINESKLQIKNISDKQKFNTLTTLLQTWWFLERTISKYK